MLGLIGVNTNNVQGKDGVTQITIALLAHANRKVRVVWIPIRRNYYH